MSWEPIKEVEVTDAEVAPAERLEASEKSNAESIRPTRFPSGVKIDMADVTLEVSRGKSKSRINKPKVDMVNHPPHYTSHPSGVECIQITEHMGFNLGNALKYIWRADLKGSAIEDLEKAVFYINRELEKRKAK